MFNNEFFLNKQTTIFLSDFSCIKLKLYYTFKNPVHIYIYLRWLDVILNLFNEIYFIWNFQLYWLKSTYYFTVKGKFSKSHFSKDQYYCEFIKWLAYSICFYFSRQNYNNLITCWKCKLYSIEECLLLNFCQYLIFILLESL